MTFEYWLEATIFLTIFILIIIVPCVCVYFMGRGMIHQLGHFPSRTPAIQLSIFLKLVILEVITFSLLMLFYHTFSNA